MTPRVGAFRFLDHDVWYEAIGEGGVPLIIVHGGPAAGHNYLEAHRVLASSRQLVFYDQLGCGLSPFDGEIDWGMEHFVEELEALRLHLGVARIALLGHSWGGMVALEYALKFGDRTDALILASTASSMANVRTSLAEALQGLKAAHPGVADSQIERLFWRSHVCRLQEWPKSLLQSARNQENNPVSKTLYGPSEFDVTGTQKNWSVQGRLHEIMCPTLITAGAYDELSSPCWMPMLKGIARARAALFGASSHLPHIEEPERYFPCLEHFLRLG